MEKPSRRAAVRETITGYATGKQTHIGAYRFANDWSHLARYDYPAEGFMAVLDRNASTDRALPPLTLRLLPDAVAASTSKSTGSHGKNTKDAKANQDIEKKYINHPNSTVVYWLSTEHADIALLEVCAATTSRKRRKNPVAAVDDTPVPAAAAPPLIAATVALDQPPIPLPLPPASSNNTLVVIGPGQGEQQRALTRLIKEGAVGHLRHVLTHQPFLLHTRLYSYGFTLLHEACREKQLAIVQLLVDEFSADVNASTEDTGATPLHQAACRGCVETVQFLLSKGARIDARTKGGYLPVHNASHWGKGAVVDLLLPLHHDATVFRAPGQHCNMTLIDEWERAQLAAAIVPQAEAVPQSPESDALELGMLLL